ncbi:MAG: hypothetical protein ACK5Y2_13590 [Bdellovibrionales bacterium]
MKEQFFMTIVTLVASIACAQSGGAGAAKTQQAPASSAATPREACQQMVDAAKANRYDRVAQMIAPDASTKKMKMKSEKGFDRMNTKYMSEIQNMSCGTEQLAGAHAMVTAETGTERRLIPFIQSEGQWKFDMKTYKAFYRHDQKDQKAKSM